MECRPLGKTGLKLSALGFGGSSLGGVFKPIDEGEGIRAVRAALDGGVNYLDTSPFYGLTKAETVLGRALKGVPRDRYFISTKVGRYGPEAKDFDFSADRVKRSIDESLGRLGVGHVDIILTHDIEFGDLDQIVNETIPALRDVQRAGKVRFVGICGLPLKIFRYVTERVPVDVALSYCHYELNDTSLTGLVPELEAKGVGVISAAPLGMGLLSEAGVPAWHPAPKEVRDACSHAAVHCRSRGASIEELAVQFAVAYRGVASTLVGTADPAQMRRNIECVGRAIDERLLAEVRDSLKPIDGITWTSGRPENN